MKNAGTGDRGRTYRKRCIVIIAASFRARYGWKAPIAMRTRESAGETRKGKKMRGVQRGEHEELVEGWKGRSEPEPLDWDQMSMMRVLLRRGKEKRGEKTPTRKRKEKERKEFELGQNPFGVVTCPTLFAAVQAHAGLP